MRIGLAARRGAGHRRCNNQTSGVLTMILRRMLCAAALAFAAFAPSSHAQTTLPPLRTGVDGTFAPHAMPKLGGGMEGFNIDLFTEVARRMKREISIESTSFSGLIPGLQSGRYDFIAAPTTVTKERAENMIFTSGYLWTSFQFGIRKGSAPIKGWDDLKGKTVSVNKGTPYETLAKSKAEALGLTVQVYDTQPDANQAVLSGRAYATLGGNTVIRYAASKTPQFVADLELTDTRAHWAAPFRRDSVALRNQMQDVLDCMKKDGSLAKLSAKWFGVTPAADALENTITPGYGVPGMPGYDPTPHPLACG
jgi:polar amino acid transport system substrate-binding protein